jgi:hypothetical protein
LLFTVYRYSVIGYRNEHVTVFLGLEGRGFSFYMLCLIETDGVAARFYRKACFPGKSCGHNIKDAVYNMEKGFSLFSFKTPGLVFRVFSLF